MIGMNWKQFLKPDKRKIVLMIIITLVWILLLRFLLSEDPKYKYITCQCPAECPGGNYIDYLIIPSSCKCCTSLSMIYNDYLWNLLLPLVISYFLSCLIVWIYDKFRKRKGYMPIQNINMVMGQQKRNIKK